MRPAFLSSVPGRHRQRQNPFDGPVSRRTQCKRSLIFAKRRDGSFPSVRLQFLILTSTSQLSSSESGISDEMIQSPLPLFLPPVATRGKTLQSNCRGPQEEHRSHL